MKNSREIADYVFKARDEYLEKKNKRKLIIGRITSFGTLGATVAAVLICAFNLLPILEDNEIEVLPPSVDIEYSTEYTEQTTHTTVSQTTDTDSENESNTETVHTDPTEPVQTDIAIVTKPVLTAALSGAQNPAQSTQAIVTKPLLTTAVTKPQEDVTLEHEIIPSVSTNANVTKPVITSAVTLFPPDFTLPTNISFEQMSGTGTHSAAQTTNSAVVTTAVTQTDSKEATEPTAIVVTLATTVSVTQISDHDNEPQPPVEPPGMDEPLATTTYITSSVITSSSHIVSNYSPPMLVTSRTVTTNTIVTEIIVTQVSSVSVTKTSKDISAETVTTTTTVNIYDAIPPDSWSDEQIAVQFDDILLSGGTYTSSGYTADESDIGSQLYTRQIWAINPSTGEQCIIRVTVYQITYANSQNIVAVKFPGNDNYYVYEKPS